MNNSLVIRQKDESENGDNKKTKHEKFSEKQIFLTPWYAHVRTYVFVSRGKKCSFFGKMACYVFLLPLFWDSSLCLITDELQFLFQRNFKLVHSSSKAIISNFCGVLQKAETRVRRRISFSRKAVILICPNKLS